MIYVSGIALSRVETCGKGWTTFIKIPCRWRKKRKAISKFLIQTRNCNKRMPTSSYKASDKVTPKYFGLRKWAASESEWTSLPKMYCLGQPCTSKGARLTWNPWITATRLLERSPLGIAFWTCFGSLPPNSTKAPFHTITCTSYPRSCFKPSHFCFFVHSHFSHSLVRKRRGGTMNNIRNNQKHI